MLEFFRKSRRTLGYLLIVLAVLSWLRSYRFVRDDHPTETGREFTREFVLDWSVAMPLTLLSIWLLQSPQQAKPVEQTPTK